MEWVSVEQEEPPKGVYSTFISDDGYVAPPKILLRFKGGEVSVAYWDFYFAEGNAGYEGVEAWVEPVSGELIVLHYNNPTHWQPLPPPPVDT